MKRTLLIALTVMFGFAVMAQQTRVGQDFLNKNVSQSSKLMMKTDLQPTNSPAVGQSTKVVKPNLLKGTDVVSIIEIGTSANGYSYGYNGGQKNILAANTDLNTITNFHRMGGDLDPGGYSGDMGYDISTDGGMTWTNMIECYVATENAGGEYYTDAARYPSHGIYNPIGNTDPNEAYVHFFAPTLDISNSADPTGWGGYGYGRTKIGDPTDTTKNLSSSDPEIDYFQYIPDSYAMTNLGEYWVAEPSFDWTSGTAVYTNNEILVNHGAWDPATERFGREYFYLELEVMPELYGPIFTKVEFSPDGQTGYIVTLADDGQVDFPQTDMRGFYPILFRTEDAGETWTDPIAVTLSGDDGIEGVLNYLLDEELADIYVAPVPERDELVFTTGFDCDLSVDQWGNPQIAVFITLNLETNYSYYYGRIAPNGHSIGAPFLLSSTDRGEEGSWIGYNLGRAYNYTYDYDVDFPEMNRIQIARNPDGDKMFVAWADTDTTISPEFNSSPDIWARGVNLNTQQMTKDDNDLPLPANVTFGSEATFSAFFFAMANEVLDDGMGNYTLPFTYQTTGGAPDPALPVTYMYIQDFQYTDADFIVGIDENPALNTRFAEVSQSSPNPAVNTARFDVSLKEATTVSVALTNMMGQTVKTLPARTMQAGSNSVSINVNDLTPGVYFYTVEAGNETITKKMIVK